MADFVTKQVVNDSSGAKVIEVLLTVGKYIGFSYFYGYFKLRYNSISLRPY